MANQTQPLFCRVLLQRGGILAEHIHDDAVTDRPCVTPCTSCHPESFFSHVRDGPDFGTQVGFLWVREAAEQEDRGPPETQPVRVHGADVLMSNKGASEP